MHRLDTGHFAVEDCVAYIPVKSIKTCRAIILHHHHSVAERSSNGKGQRALFTGMIVCTEFMCQRFAIA